MKFVFENVIDETNDIKLINSLEILNGKCYRGKIKCLRHAFNCIKIRMDDQNELYHFIEASKKYKIIFYFIIQQIKIKLNIELL